MTAEVLGDTGDWTTDEWSYLLGISESVGYAVARDFPGVDREDLAQEALMWAVQHPRKMREYLSHEDPQQAGRLLSSSMRNEARAFAVKQRALARGDDSFIDDAWYSKEMLKGFGRSIEKRGLLHHVFDQDSWLNPEKGESSGVRSKRDPAEGNTWLATLADVSSALDKLKVENPAAHTLLVLHYQQGYTYDEIGEGLRIPKVTVSRRIDQAVRKIQDLLGGQKPRTDLPEDGWENGLVGTRRSITNAHARAITSEGYDE